MIDGWIKIHRKIQNNWIFKDSDYLRAWIIVLMTVNFEQKKVLISGELIDCNRGQSLFSLANWAEIFGKKWTIQRVRTFFELLRKDEMITTEGLRKTTRLTVCKYEDYQESQQRDNTEKTSTEQGDNTEITTTKERKKEKKEKKEKELIIYPEILTFEFVFEMWLQYKKERRETYKSESSKKIAFEKMKQLSGNSPETAKLVVEQSMAANWAGMFELKNKPKNTQPQNSSKITPEEMAEFEKRFKVNTY